MFVSVAVVAAVLIGGIEPLGLMGDIFALKGAFWRAIDALSRISRRPGWFGVSVFAAWIASIILYRYKGLEEIARARPSDSPWRSPRRRLFGGERRRVERRQRGARGIWHRLRPPAVFPFGEDVGQLRHHPFGEEACVVLRQIFAHVAEL
jgi:hypothetical protein